jgi:hypothetical protein
MACPICSMPDSLGELCPVCRQNGYIDLGCGCVESPTGQRPVVCSGKHRLCLSCGVRERQHSSDQCGPCRAEEDSYVTQQARWTA